MRIHVPQLLRWSQLLKFNMYYNSLWIESGAKVVVIPPTPDTESAGGPEAIGVRAQSAIQAASLQEAICMELGAGFPIFSFRWRKQYHLFGPLKGFSLWGDV